MGEKVKRTTITMPCSGCYEPGEYGGNEHLYQWDAKARCRVGAGCRECGYTGKRRVDVPTEDSSHD
jgi:hypothetical protein